MYEAITFDMLRAMVCDIADVMQANADFLTQLDVAIGDGDHGHNMAVGFEIVCQELESMPPSTPGILLRSTGMTLVTTVGGASGPLYGAAFLAAGIVAGSNKTVGLADLADMMESAADAVARRGRCRLGDKTMFDALEPAAVALAAAAREKRTLRYGLQLAADAAREGMEATTPLVARRGLAMQYGAASAGHQDPGAASCYLIFDSILRTYRRLSSTRMD